MKTALFFTRVKTRLTMTPQWFILMDKLLIYQIRFQSASSCAKTGPRKENPFVWGRNVKFTTIHRDPNHKKGMTCYGSIILKSNIIKKQ